VKEERILLGGDAVRIDEQVLKGGGQAVVHKVPNRPELVVKLYREPPGEEQERRLRSMLRINPLGGRPTGPGQPPELAWPTALAHDEQGRFRGYSMRKFSEPEHVQLVGLFTRVQRLRFFPPEADWRFLLGVAWNLSFMTARMHTDELVIGDFSSNNVVVDRNGFVTFLDCDSISFTDPVSGDDYPCTMQTADYSAPERQGGGPATRETDQFALSVLIYQLLTAGNHPFGGVPQDSDEDSTVQDNINASRSYVVTPEAVTVPRGVIDPTVLPPSLLKLASRAFGPGVEDPKERPSADDWLEALDQERAAVKVCKAKSRHSYGSHLNSCPWCARAQATGQDVFNPPPPRPGGDLAPRPRGAAQPFRAPQQPAKAGQQHPAMHWPDSEAARRAGAAPAPVPAGKAAAKVAVIAVLGVVLLMLVFVAMAAQGG
jgi:DNA-binding helix-hairpin-helix protein with protein kinase domain